MGDCPWQWRGSQEPCQARRLRPRQTVHSQMSDTGAAINGGITAGIGTPAFMPPEAFKPIPDGSTCTNVLAKRDWYGLGCCLALMLLGERGGRVALCGHRAVLLPTKIGDISACSSTEALALASSLTADDLGQRAGSAELRSSPFLHAAILSAEEV